MDPILDFGLDAKLKLLTIEGLREKNLLSLGLQLQTVNHQINLIRILNSCPTPKQNIVSLLYKSSLPLLLRTRHEITLRIDLNLRHLDDLLRKLHRTHEEGMKLLKDLEESNAIGGKLLESILKRIRTIISNSSTDQNDMDTLMYSYMKSISENRIRKRSSEETSQDQGLCSSNETKKKKRIRLLSENDYWSKCSSSLKYSSLPHHQPSSVISTSQDCKLGPEKMLSFSNSLPNVYPHFDLQNLHIPESSQISKELNPRMRSHSASDFKKEVGTSEPIEKIECSNPAWIEEVLFPSDLKVKIDLSLSETCSLKQSPLANSMNRLDEISSPVSLSVYTDSVIASGKSQILDDVGKSVINLESCVESWDSPPLILQSDKYLSNSILRSDPINADVTASLSSLTNSKSQSQQHTGKENSPVE